jgi:hypothetical protein
VCACACRGAQEGAVLEGTRRASDIMPRRRMPSRCGLSSRDRSVQALALNGSPVCCKPQRRIFFLARPRRLCMP